MYFNNLLYISFFALGLNNNAYSAEWHYENGGTEKWKEDFYDCGGKSQSPINIVADDTYYLDKLSPISLYNYAIQPRQLVMINNGHTVAVATEGDQFIEGGGLPTTYKLAQFHFHWGSADDKGSEHRIDGKMFPMELHMVHYAIKMGDIPQAVNAKQGLAVLGFMFEISAMDNPAFDPIIRGLEVCQYKNVNTTMDPFPLLELLPNNYLDRFYRYQGSLTTPECYESVVWTVFEESIRISENQLQKFRNLTEMTQAESETAGTMKRMVNNYRPPQPLNTRFVYTSNSLIGKQMPGQPVPTQQVTTPSAANTIKSMSVMFFVMLSVVVGILN